MSPKRSKQEEQVQTAIRLTKSMLARVNKLALRLSVPGIHVTRTQAHRIALLHGLDYLDGNTAPVPSPPKKKEKA